MPTMANITVKKNDGTTDIVYTQKTASGGDSSPATWRSDSVGTAANQRPSFQMTTASNGPKTARRSVTRYVYPSLVTGSDGRVSVADQVIIEVNAIVPLGMSDTDVNEAIAQGLNLNASALIKDSFKAGYAPV